MSEQHIRIIDGQEVIRGSREYWRLVAVHGVPEDDADAVTCEHDSGYGPCGRYRQWGFGKCKNGGKITFSDEE